MVDRRQTLFSALLDDCSRVYVAGSRDLWTHENTVENYVLPENQLKYVHMYCIKSVAAWRSIRRMLGMPADGPVYSVGAGPCLCLFGWFYDAPPDAGQEVAALDVLRWEAVSSLSSFIALKEHFFAHANFSFDAPAYFPDELSPQMKAASVTSGRAIQPEEFPVGATVLLPWVMNHLLGENLPHRQPGAVVDWIERVRRRVKRVVVVDMPFDKSKDFWKRLWLGLGLGLPTAMHEMSFVQQCREMISFYNDGQGGRRSGGRAPHFCSAAGLLGTQEGWNMLGRNARKAEMRL